MARNTPEINGDRRAVTAPTASGRRTRLRSLDDLDGRTLAARKARELVAGLESDLGGSDSLTTGQRELVKRTALTGALVEDLEVGWLEGEPIDIGEYSTLINAQRRLLVVLGLDRKAKLVNPPDLTPRIIERLKAAQHGARP